MPWYYYVLFLLVGVVVTRIFYMFWEICQPLPPAPIISDAEFRIVPEYSGRFQVEHRRYHYGAHQWENASFGRGHMAPYEETNFRAEKEAEAYIFRKLEAKRKFEIERKKKMDFKTANPPREIPPFKYDHGDKI